MAGLSDMIAKEGASLGATQKSFRCLLLAACAAIGVCTGAVEASQLEQFVLPGGTQISWITDHKEHPAKNKFSQQKMTNKENDLMSLRTFVQRCAATAIVFCSAAAAEAEPPERGPMGPRNAARFQSILLRDFRTVKDGKVICYNIGTAAHAFGNLAVLQKHLPEAQVTVWADAPLDASLAGMMRKRFPKVAIVTGSLKDGEATPPGLAEAVKSADLFLISSGNGIASSVAKSLKEFQEITEKPAAAYAIGCDRSQFPILNQLDSASFRDSKSLARAEKSENDRICWAPDAVFDFDCADDVYAEAFLEENSWLPGEFVCCIPGQRATPRWEFFGGPASPRAIQLNEASAAHDQALLREVITYVVRRWRKKVLLCAEQIPEMALLAPLYRSLPEDVAASCAVLPEFWNPAQALGIYRRSAAVFGIEMHSQVMALGNGIPSAVFRHRGFGPKSTMWEDIGVPEWLLEIDDPDSTEKACTIVDDLLSDPVAAREKVRHCRERIDSAAEAAVRMQFRRK